MPESMVNITHIFVEFLINILKISLQFFLHISTYDVTK